MRVVQLTYNLYRTLYYINVNMLKVVDKMKVYSICGCPLPTRVGEKLQEFCFRHKVSLLLVDIDPWIVGYTTTH